LCLLSLIATTADHGPPTAADFSAVCGQPSAVITAVCGQPSAVITAVCGRPSAVVRAIC
jgi:hypothetical protein